MTTISSPSRIQEQFWLASNMLSKNIAYNVPLAFFLSSTPDLLNLETAFNLIIQKNESLRSSFLFVKGKLIQTITDPIESKISLLINQREEYYRSEDAKKILEEESDYYFDLSQYPLFRIKLTQFGDSKALLTIVFHHIVIDLTSIDLFCKDLSFYYNSLQNGEFISTHQYSDFVLWQKSWLSSALAKQKLENWVKKISTPLELLNLPTKKQKTISNSLTGKQKYFFVDEPISYQIGEYTQKKHISQFLFLFSCYAILLNRLCSQDKIIIGVPFTNRMRISDKSTLGCYVNTLPVHVDFTNNPSILQLIEQIRKEFLFVHRNQEIPLLEIIEKIDNGQIGSSNSLFQVGFTKEPLPDIDFVEIKSESLIVERHGVQLDLFLKIIDVKHSIKMVFEYNSELFEENTINHWIKIYLEIINSFLKSDTQKINQLNILPSSEQELIRNWNDTCVVYEKELCVHQKLEQISLNSPELPALRFGNLILSYNELNTHSNRFANFLISKGIKVEDIIAVCVDRSLEMMIGIYGILKAGATYLPLNPKYPQGRLAEIITDANPKLIITDSKSDKNLPDNSTIVYIDNILIHPLIDDNNNPNSGVRSNNLAYITYTSGSTGKPKGVMIEHHSLMNRIDWMQKQFPLTSDDVLVQKTTITFDVSIWELFWWSFTGSSLAILPPEAESEPLKIIDEIYFHKVSVIHFVPSMFSVFIGYLKASHLVNRLSGLRWIFASGEELTPKTVNEFNKLRIYSSLPNVINLYGPTEATIDVSFYSCPITDDIKEIPIGKTIDNTQLYIINKANKIQPCGIPGELVIAGVNLARGYFNNTELTNKKFPTIEIEPGIEIRIYKTGDIAKWNQDGDIIFIGRMDNQIKIRGFRIELGEIEAKLLNNPKIKEATVLLQNTNNENPILIAFVVLFPEDKSESGQIKKYLVEKLPNFMIPNQIHIIEKMPISANGKIDKKALMEFAATKSVHLELTSSSIEQNLVSVYKKTLGLKSVRITDNFFDIGGNSLMTIKLINVLFEEYGIKIEVVKVFEYPNIKELASYLTTINNNENTKTLNLNTNRRSLKYAHQLNQIPKV
jgi:amino acid adenylation domain-containing protein